LVQLDGSFHPWFESRGPSSCLLTLVDDATGRSLGQFGAQETIWAAVAVLRRWIETYGIPRALYTDWKNVYVRVPNQTERATGIAPLTQFGRMCATLGIQIIPASSPQAKGRVERNHGTQQDRLVKKLRRQGIADLATANAFLETYWPDHNAGLPAVRCRPTIFTWRPHAVSTSTPCFASTKNGWCPMIGSCGTPTGTFSSSGRVGRRRRGARSWSPKTSLATLKFGIEASGCAGQKSSRGPSRPCRRHA